ncbi:hypothetical protein Vretifemale_20255 [Volvox reticuliferus]|uniref:RNA methyltransferase n=1 Tax=Volvox reticuliferus TaxID=1737510 RepID=A0A8J4D658_9CHLO|nr:hypothetical protein Vretifemale_20255 [Volvox reticuliferus]
MSEAANCGAMAGQHAMPPTDPGTLVQQLKSQLLPSDKTFSKNQKKKARKKVTKIIQKTLGIYPRPGVNADGITRTDAEGQPSSQDTGCCSNHRASVGVGEASPACASSPQIAKSSHSPGAAALPRRSVMEATDAADASAMPPPSKRRRLGSALKRSSSGAPIVGPSWGRLPPDAPAVAWHAEKAAYCRRHEGAGRSASRSEGLPATRGKDTRAIAQSCRPIDSGSPSVDGGRGGSTAPGGSSQMSLGALKRLSRRQSRPEDLLTADDGDDDGNAATATAGPSHTRSGSEAGAKAVVAATYCRAHIAGGVKRVSTAAATRKRRDRRQSGRSLEKRVRPSGDGAALGTAASEEVIQIPLQAGTAASAAAVAGAAATAVHRGYALYGGTFVTATAAAAHLTGGNVARQVLGPVRGMPMACGGAAARGPVDLSAALIMMRVQLRASEMAGSGGAVPSVIGTADIASGVDGSVPAMLTATTDANMGTGSAGTICISGYSSERQARADSGSVAALLKSCALSAGVEGGAAAALAGGSGRLGLHKVSMQEQKQKQPPSKAQQSDPQAPVRASRYRYGNYHRYYGYRMSADMDEDPRVKVMRREWFQQRVCIDVGCNEVRTAGRVLARLAVFVGGTVCSPGTGTFA